MADSVRNKSKSPGTKKNKARQSVDEYGPRHDQNDNSKSRNRTKSKPNSNHKDTTKAKTPSTGQNNLSVNSKYVEEHKKALQKQKSRDRLNKGKLAEQYMIKEKLGKGNFAVVRRVVRRQDNREFAAKIISKKHLSKDELEDLLQETQILSKLRHPHVVELVEVIDTPRHLYIVLEILTGGELFDRIIQRGHFSEQEAANIVRQLAAAIAYLHDNGVVHRDLKPENLIYSSPAEDALIKVTDFGLAKEFEIAKINDNNNDNSNNNNNNNKNNNDKNNTNHNTSLRALKKASIIRTAEDEEDDDVSESSISSRRKEHTTRSILSTACGTPGYVAPEILKQNGYDEYVDLWSCGVILYILLCGYPPFHADNVKVLYRKIKKGEYEFPERDWSRISEEAKDCVRGLLTVDPKKRMSAKELLEHPWIRSASLQSPRNIATSMWAGNIKTYQHKKRLRRGVELIISLNRMIRGAGLELEARQQRIEFRSRLKVYKEKLKQENRDAKIAYERKHGKGARNPNVYNGEDTPPIDYSKV